MDLSVHNRYQTINKTQIHPYKTEFVVNWLLNNKSERQKNNDKNEQVNPVTRESKSFHSWEESWSILRKFQDAMIASQGVCLKTVLLFTRKYPLPGYILLNSFKMHNF